MVMPLKRMPSPPPEVLALRLTQPSSPPSYDLRPSQPSPPPGFLTNPKGSIAMTVLPLQRMPCPPPGVLVPIAATGTAASCGRYRPHLRPPKLKRD